MPGVRQYCSQFDATVTKLEVDHKLHLEEETVAFLSNQLAHSAELASGMVSILDRFEDRLAKLETTILPVYQETLNLRRRQENIDKTLEALDHVIGFYNVSKDVEPVVVLGPRLHDAGSLQGYLNCLSRLKMALDYFVTYNDQSLELENVRRVYELGGDALSREFSDQVKKHSKPLLGVDVLNAIHAANGQSLFQFSDAVKTDLISMSEWLSFNDYDDFMNVYAVVRASILSKTLDNVWAHLKTASVGRHSPLGGQRSKAAATVDISPNVATAPRRKSKLLLSSTLNRRLSKSVASRLSAGSSSPVVASDDGLNADLDEFESFCLIVSALQMLMWSERNLMLGIIPYTFQKKMFEIITRDALDKMNDDFLEEVLQRYRKSLTSHDFLSVVSVFHVIRHLKTIQPEVDRTLEGSEACVRSKYNCLMSQLCTTGFACLDGLAEAVRLEANAKEKMAKDGTVNQLTANVMLFLEQLVPYSDVAASVLVAQDPAYNHKLLRLEKPIGVNERNAAVIGLYVRQVLVQLSATMVSKSESYHDPYLRAIFRLNNYQHVLTSLQRSGLLAMVILVEPTCELTYSDLIVEQKRLYSQSWARLLSYIWNAADDVPNAILCSQGKLPDKICRIIKDKFSGFNREMESLSQTQRLYSVPDVELRESLIRDNKEYICPKYQSFYNKYSVVHFSKNLDKYVKWSPAEVSSAIDTFFDAAA